ncbi:hypothetical protein [Actinokineospora enzanensis]|uniref:hypothetical protein n=1 Tax=Actinokineospora enzanensis TaxID=155975 RepID=UPI00037E69B0|nr:hypothetical protein [Actinokineospora enzanensis]
MSTDVWVELGYTSDVRIEATGPGEVRLLLSDDRTNTITVAADREGFEKLATTAAAAVAKLDQFENED